MRGKCFVVLLDEAGQSYIVYKVATVTLMIRLYPSDMCTRATDRYGCGMVGSNNGEVD